jgi:hypothetical protein
MKWSEVKWSEVTGNKLWWGCEGCVSVVKWNEGKVLVKCECISSWHYAFHYCYCLVYSMLILLNINLFDCGWNCICFSCICIAFIVCSVSFVCVVLCAVFCLSVVCYFVPQDRRVIIKKLTVCYLLLSGYLLSLLFSPEDGGNMFLLNVSETAFLLDTCFANSWAMKMEAVFSFEESKKLPSW